MTQTPPHEPLNSLLERAEERERQSRRRTLYYSIVPVVLVGILLAFTAWQIDRARKDLKTVRAEYQSTQQELAKVSSDFNAVQNQYSQVQVQLSETTTQLSQANAQLIDKQSAIQIANVEAGQIQQELYRALSDLNAARATITDTQKTIASLQTQLNSLNLDIADAEVQLSMMRSAEPFRRSIYTMDAVQEKEFYNQLYAASQTHERVYSLIKSMQYQDVKFSIRGASPDAGFNSPNFAIYVLQQYDLLPAKFDINGRPWEQLSAIKAPKMGDLVYYEGGYTMFYYENQGQAFVIGMTPAGILALKPDFAPILGYLEVPYKR